MDTRWYLFALAVLVSGCHDEESVRDVYPPAAPRGVYTVTGDRSVTVHWLPNTEPDVAGYWVYEARCAAGDDCPYDYVGGTGATSFTVTGLANGATRYYAVTAYDQAGNESPLSEEILFDTPRPAGRDAALSSYLQDSLSAGWDFSAMSVRPWGDEGTDMFFGSNGNVSMMFVPDLQTDIQDAGYAESLDAVDFAPTAGWSPTGSVELIVGHCYVVWTRDDHYAKFRVTRFIAPGAGPPSVEFDWAYQVDPGNRELRATKVKTGERGAPRPIAWPS